MKTVDFARTIREKYPNGVASDGTSYADMNDQDLVGKVVQKYPIYKKQLEDMEDSESGLIGSPIGAVKEFGSDVVSAFKERGSNIKEAVVPDNQEEAQKMIKGGQGKIALRVGGQVGGLVGDLELSVLKLVAPKFAEDLAMKGLQKVSETEFVQNVTQKLDEFKQKHPEAAQDLEDVVNIAAIIPYVKGTEVAVKGTQKGLQTVSKVTDKVIDSNRASRIANATDEIDSVVGKIVQGKTDDVLKAKKALSTINTEGIKTYSELGDRIDDGIEALAGKVDDLLEETGAKVGQLKSDKLVTATKVGNKSIKQKFVNDALDQLDELYVKIKDAPKKAAIMQLKTKLAKEGLSLKELNDLSRTYNKEFGKKAFSKLGDPLTSVNAQAFENTRKGIKNVVRNLMPDDTVKMLDERMSDLYNTNRLVGKMEEKVNALYQKASKRGVLERVSRGAADVVNAATFNTLSGFISRMLPSNVGLKVLNSIDLEKALSKNLKNLDKLLEVTNDASLTDGIVKFVKENAR